jgi:hypothetical protein
MRQSLQPGVRGLRLAGGDSTAPSGRLTGDTFFFL